jgi:DNA-binding beta-propeller fold protein YncE
MKKTGIRLALLTLLLATVLITRGGSGGDGGGGVTPATQVNPRFVYMSNYDANSVSTYWVDASTGRLKLAATVATGKEPSSVTVDPTGKYVYATNFMIDSVSQYTIGADGALTPVTPTVAAGPLPSSIPIVGSYE